MEEKKCGCFIECDVVVAARNDVSPFQAIIITMLSVSTKYDRPSPHSEGVLRHHMNIVGIVTEIYRHTVFRWRNRLHTVVRCLV